MSKFISAYHKGAFRLRSELVRLVKAPLRKIWWSIQGTVIGAQTNVPRLYISWPHQVSIGRKCILEEDIFFKFDGPWQPGPSILIHDSVFIGRACEFNIRKYISIGNDCLIASGCKFIDHDHGLTNLHIPMNLQLNNEAPIILEKNVWLGVNVVVLKGVTIGHGAVVGAGSVVTKSIPCNQVWAGIPAKKLRDRVETFHI